VREWYPQNRRVGWKNTYRQTGHLRHCEIELGLVNLRSDLLTIGSTWVLLCFIYYSGFSQSYISEVVSWRGCLDLFFKEWTEW
jgi:hypothetical protein